MSWTYEQSTGVIRDLHGVTAGVGYSGRGACKNAPHAQAVPGEGPIPRGLWDILGPPLELPGLGPYVLRLEPYIETKTFARDAFVIRGEDARPEFPANDFIVLPLVVRREIWESNDHILEVVA